nr:hypothetical protein BaRGS_004085 [Batillaria attramentaria]
MIAVAIRTMKRRRGTSRQAIIKFVRTHYHLHSLTDKQFKVNLNRALRAGVERGTFVQVKGVGAVGSFRLGEALKGKPIECHIVRNPDNRGVRLGIFD